MGRQAAQIRLNDLIKQGKALPTWKMVGGRRIRSYRLTTK
jgi:ribosomal protein L39E